MALLTRATLRVRAAPVDSPNSHRAVRKWGAVATDDELDWDDLRYFLRTVEAGTFAGAARNTGVKHSTVCRRLDALESALGAALVVRRPDGVEPTPLGVQVAARAADIERTVAAIRSLATERSGHVRIAIPSSVSVLLSPHLDSFRREHPNVTLEMLSDSRPVDLTKGEAELAIRVGPISEPDLVVRKVGDAGVSLYASESYLALHPVRGDLSDLAGHDVIGYDTALASFPPAQWIEQHASGARIVLRCREMSDLVTAAVDGLGVAALACWVAARHPSLRRLTREVIARRSVSIVYRREARLAPHVRLAIQFVTRVMSDQAAILSGDIAEPALAPPRGA
jgi:DNA-binding transcriptional LysR family regulator